MVRTIPLLLLLLLAASGCGEATTSHRVPRSGPEPVREPAAADALTKPPRAIATH